MSFTSFLSGKRQPKENSNSFDSIQRSIPGTVPLKGQTKGTNHGYNGSVNPKGKTIPRQVVLQAMTPEETERTKKELLQRVNTAWELEQKAQACDAESAEAGRKADKHRARAAEAGKQADIHNARAAEAGRQVDKHRARSEEAGRKANIHIARSEESGQKASEKFRQAEMSEERAKKARFEKESAERSVLKRNENIAKLQNEKKELHKQCMAVDAELDDLLAGINLNDQPAPQASNIPSHRAPLAHKVAKPQQVGQQRFQLAQQRRPGQTNQNSTSAPPSIDGRKVVPQLVRV